MAVFLCFRVLPEFLPEIKLNKPTKLAISVIAGAIFGRLMGLGIAEFGIVFFAKPICIGVCVVLGAIAGIANEQFSILERVSKRMQTMKSEV